MRNTIKILLSEIRAGSNDEKYEKCFVSDLMRMDLIELFFNKVDQNESYNLHPPNFDKLIDGWDGYDDQVYIQNNLQNNQFIFWEGWVSSCWQAAYLKPEYKGLDKKTVIQKIITDRFPIIGDDFGYQLVGYNFFKHKGKYIMNVTFQK